MYSVALRLSAFAENNKPRPLISQNKQFNNFNSFMQQSRPNTDNRIIDTWF